MRWLKRGLAVLALLVLLGAGGLAIRVLASLDWSREHRSRAESLPLLAAGQPDGLVRIEANGLTFRARVAGLGNPKAPVILLHGFPATSIMWEPVIDAAARAGHPVLAFDQRGYSPGARPEGVDAYLVPRLVEDVIAVADASGFERFHLVGHDWGCIVGWGVAIGHPDRVISWSGVSIPHPGTLVASLKAELPAYIQAFTAPLVPETLALARGLEFSEPIPPHHADEYLAVLSEPGALTGTLNWYRAITVGLDDAQSLEGAVTVPTLFIWGTGEQWVTPERLEHQRTLVTGPYQELELEGGHWILEEQTLPVVQAVMGQLDTGVPTR